ncbi:MAG: hypothetical protein R3F62_01370 [Planctomycetota bacterium]
MRIIQDTAFRLLRDDPPGISVEDLHFSNCVFDNCSLSLTRDPRNRTWVHNVVLADCELFNCQVGPALLDEVRVHNLKTNDIGIVNGALFRRVVLTGRIGSLRINPDPILHDQSPSVLSSFDADREKFYASIDWALDIRHADFVSFAVEGVPARLIRRDPETQVVVSRERALGRDWSKLSESVGGYWTDMIDTFLYEGTSELVLAAPRGARRSVFQQRLSGLRELRALGVAEPEGNSPGVLSPLPKPIAPKRKAQAKKTQAKKTQAKKTQAKKTQAKKTQAKKTKRR